MGRDRSSGDMGSGREIACWGRQGENNLEHEDFVPFVLRCTWE